MKSTSKNSYLKLSLILVLIATATSVSGNLLVVHAGGPERDYDERYEDIPGTNECWYDGYADETGEDTSSAGEDTSSAGEDTSSASQDYQDFQSCLSAAEVDGYATEQQIRDCFAPIYNTGTDTGTDTGTGTTSPAGDEDTTSTDNTGSEGEGGEEASK